MAQFQQSFSLFADGITINPITAAANSTFTVSGSLTGFTAAPSLSYQDDGGTAVVIGATNISATSYSFSHPPMSAGNHTISIGVTGDPRQTTANYTISGNSVPGPVTAISLSGATYNTLRIAFTPPATTQTLTYNCSLGTVGLGGPFPLSFTGLAGTLDLVGNTFIIIPNLTYSTNYYCQINAVAPGNLVGSPATAGPFTTLAPTIVVNAVFPTAGSPFLVTGSIS